MSRYTDFSKKEQCAQNFLRLVSTTKYVFHVAKRGVKVLTLDFELKDFHHLAGLQYLDDINIPKNKKKTIAWILSEKHLITDAYLAGSELLSEYIHPKMALKIIL